MNKVEIDAINKQLIDDLESKGVGTGVVTIDTHIMPNGIKYIEIRLLADERILYKWFEKPKKDKPKRGGKKTYHRFSNEWLEKTDVNLIGYCAKLLPYVEYGTVRLINKRTKKSLTKKDFEKIWGLSKNPVSELIRKLKDINVLYAKDSSYYFNSKELIDGGNNG